MSDIDRVIGRVAGDADPQLALSAKARDRAFGAAFAGTPATAATPAAIVRRRWLVPAGLAFAAAAGAAVIAVVIARSPATEPDRHGAALPIGRDVRVGHARVRAAADSLAWQTGASGVFVMSGSVHVDVDPEPRRAFQVRTQRFVVDVLGTAFTVTTDDVVVERGAVRISTPDGVVIDDRVEAGERWSSSQIARREAAGEPGPEPEPPEIDLDNVEPEPARPAPRTVDPKVLLERARSLLLAGDTGEARAVAERLLDASPARGLRAQAEIVIAESYLRDQRLDAAIARFEAIAQRYRDLAVGEQALYAAAQNRARRGDRAGSRRLFERYLARYPDGALAADARKALESIR
jgi:hypothetical protein